MPEMSGKCKSNPTKTNNLKYIKIFLRGGEIIFFMETGVKNKFTPLLTESLFTPLRSRLCNTMFKKHLILM